MSKPDPIFGKPDPAAADDLPPELQGKSAGEIAAYYRKRESILMDRLNRKPAEPPKPAAPPDDKIDMINDPEGSITRTATRITNDVVNRAAAVVAPGVVASCKMILREQFTNAARFMPEVERRMNTMSAEAQMNPELWKTVYFNVKGENSDKLRDEAVAHALKEKESPVEHGNAPGREPPKPKELTEEEKLVAKKFDMEQNSYRDAAQRYDETDGKLPFTYDSRKSKKKAS